MEMHESVVSACPRVINDVYRHREIPTTQINKWLKQLHVVVPIGNAKRAKNLEAFYVVQGQSWRLWIKGPTYYKTPSFWSSFNSCTAELNN